MKGECQANSDVRWNESRRQGLLFGSPVVAYVCEHTQHLVQVGGNGVSPSLGELRVIIGNRRLVHPAWRRVAAVQQAEVAFARRQFQLQLPHEGAELPHEELQLRGLVGAAYPQLELGPQRGVEETLPPSRADGRGPQLVSVGQKGEYVDDKLAGQSHGSDTPAQSHGELKRLLSVK